MNISVELGSLLADPGQTGAYYVDARDREALVEAGRLLRYTVAPIDLRTCADLTAVLREIADALSFPDWFGGNLDALADSLNDLSWLPSGGYVLLLEHIGDWRERAPDEVDDVVDILNDAAARWADEQVPFWTFLPLSARELETMGSDDSETPS